MMDNQRRILGRSMKTHTSHLATTNHTSNTCILQKPITTMKNDLHFMLPHWTVNQFDAASYVGSDM